MDFHVVVDSLTKIVSDIINFIPRMINGLIILIVGYLIAVVIRWVLRTILQRVRLDQLIDRTGLAQPLRDLGVRTPFSQLLAQIIFALLLISFLITATRLMGLEAVAQLLEQLLRFLPQAIAALIVFLLGGLAATFVGNLVSVAGEGVGLSYARQLGRAVQTLVSVFVVILALGVLGIDTALLVTALTITIAAFGLAIGLALGLGARPVVFQILVGYYMRQRYPAGQTIIVDQTRGEVTGVGSVNTTVATPTETLVIPNSVLFESLVRIQSTPRPPTTTPAPETPPTPEE